MHYNTFITFIIEKENKEIRSAPRIDFVGSRTKSEKGMFGAWISTDSTSDAE